MIPPTGLRGHISSKCFVKLSFWSYGCQYDNSNHALNLNFSLQESIGPIQDLPEEKSEVAKGVGSETQGINLMASSYIRFEL